MRITIRIIREFELLLEWTLHRASHLSWTQKAGSKKKGSVDDGSTTESYNELIHDFQYSSTIRKLYVSILLILIGFMT